MKNIKLNQASMFLKYKYVDSPQVNYNETLKSKLSHIIKGIELAFVKMKGLLFEQLIEEASTDNIEILALTEELKLIEKWFKDKGYTRLESLIFEIGKKDINEDDYDILLEILTSQIEYFQTLLESTDSFIIGQLEVVLRYMREIPFYLEFDLDLSSLRNKKNIDQKRYSLEGVSEQVIFFGKIYSKTDWTI
ncbi:hypothetical protein [Massilibacterium senegalense]|uniref:hypothetical protein n=1 Tax=Massilibacterium senegalense TaxID=1632858 RepID=UPI0007849B0D|nr:hypothetical protein [Massilibacterium senegalense]